MIRKLKPGVIDGRIARVPAVIHSFVSIKRDEGRVAADPHGLAFLVMTVPLPLERISIVEGFAQAAGTGRAANPLGKNGRSPGKRSNTVFASFHSLLGGILTKDGRLRTLDRGNLRVRFFVHG